MCGYKALLNTQALIEKEKIKIFFLILKRGSKETACQVEMKQLL